MHGPMQCQNNATLTTVNTINPMLIESSLMPHRARTLWLHAKDQASSAGGVPPSRMWLLRLVLHLRQADSENNRNHRHSYQETTMELAYVQELQSLERRQPSTRPAQESGGRSNTFRTGRQRLTRTGVPPLSLSSIETVRNLKWRPRRESNPQPSDPKSDALSN